MERMLSTYLFALLFIIVLIILVAIAAAVLFWLAYREPLRRRKSARVLQPIRARAPQCIGRKF